MLLHAELEGAPVSKKVITGIVLATAFMATPGSAQSYGPVPDYNTPSVPIYTPSVPIYTPSMPGYAPSMPTYTPPAPSYTPPSTRYDDSRLQNPNPRIRRGPEIYPQGGARRRSCFGPYCNKNQ